MRLGFSTLAQLCNSVVKTTVADRGWWDCSFLTVPMAEGRKDVTPLCLL